MARIFTQKHYAAIASMIREQRDVIFESPSPSRVHTELRLLLGVTDGIVDMLKADSSEFDEVEFRSLIARGEVSSDARQRRLDD